MRRIRRKPAHGRGQGRHLMFDALVRDIAQRFGLGDKARDLLGELLALIFDNKNGGIAGLLARFRQQGLGDLFASWLGGTQAKPAEPSDIEARSEEHTSELQSRRDLVCRLLLEKKKKNQKSRINIVIKK